MPGQHALISPSACGRIGYCPASVMLSKDIPNESSQYAEEGTAAHRMAELDLTAFFNGQPFNDAEQSEKEAIRSAYPEAPGYVGVYTNYVAELAKDAIYKAVEVRLPMTPITGEPDAFGTADCLIIAGDTLHVVDLKYGAGVKVDAGQNAQLGMYALAALAELDPDGMLYDVLNVKMHIVQPRMDNISTWEIDRRVLEENFAVHMRRAASRALHLVEHPDDLQVGYPFLAMKNKPSGGDFAEPSDKICRFCRAKAVCPILQKITVETLEQDFEDLESVDTKAEPPAPVVEQIRSIPVPDTPERLAAAYGWPGGRCFARLVGWFCAGNLLLAGTLLLPGAQTNNGCIYLPLSPGALLAGAGGVVLAVQGVLRFLGRSGGQVFPARLTVADTALDVRAFCDTGFSVQEPLSGRTVVLVRFGAVQGRLPPALGTYLEQHFAGAAPLPDPALGVRLVPCTTVAGHCILPAVPASLCCTGSSAGQGMAEHLYAAFADLPPPPDGWEVLVGSETVSSLAHG